MENREQIVAEYFQLRVLLNKSNLKSNEKTEIEIRIRLNDRGDIAVVAGLKGNQNSHFIEICSKKAGFSWYPRGYSGFDQLENFCADFLRTKNSKNPTKNEFDQIAIQLQLELRSLGISK